MITAVFGRAGAVPSPAAGSDSAPECVCLVSRRLFVLTCRLNCLLRPVVQFLIQLAGTTGDDRNDWKLCHELAERAGASAIAKKWLKVLQDNDVYTAQDWKDFGRDEGLRVSCGAKLRTILDNLAGVTASWEARGVRQ
jgi:hypothetical protein